MKGFIVNDGYVYISTILTQYRNTVQKKPPLPPHTHFALAVAVARVFGAALARLTLGSVVVGGTADPKRANTEPSV